MPNLNKEFGTRPAVGVNEINKTKRTSNEVILAAEKHLLPSLFFTQWRFEHAGAEVENKLHVKIHVLFSNNKKMAT